MVGQARFWKISIHGPSIQGVMLREAIVGLKEDMDSLDGIGGFARNYGDHVEVIIKATEEQAKTLSDAVIRIPESEMSMGIVSFKTAPELQEISNPEKFFSRRDFEDFGIKRDGEQKEMMLALQGAGKLFRKSAEIQRGVSKKLDERDENKVKGLLLSLYYENILNRDAIRADRASAVSTIALEQGVMSPPIPTAAFVNQLTEVLQRLNEFKGLNEKMPQSEGEILINVLDSFKETLTKELEGRDIKVS